MTSANEELFSALNLGSVDRVTAALASGASASCVKDDECALTMAVKTRNADIVVALLRAGADVEQEVNGRSAASTAVVARDVGVLTVLLAAGADANALVALNPTRELERVPLAVFALRKRSHECLSLLLAAGAHWSPRAAQQIDSRFFDDTAIAALFHPRAAERELHLVAFGFCRERAAEVSIALQDLDLPAPLLIEICIQACFTFGPTVPFHLWWNLTTAVKHFHTRSRATATDPRADAKGSVLAARAERSQKVRECAKLLYTKWKIVGKEHTEADLHAAHEALEFIIDVRTRALGDDHELVTEARFSMGQVLHSQGRLEAARAMFEAVIVAERRDYGESSEHCLVSQHELARVLRSLGDLEGSKVAHERLLAIKRRMFGDDNSITLNSMHSLACALLDLGEIRAAQALFVDVAAGRERTLAPTHRDVTLVRCNLAYTHQLLGELDAALPLAQNAVEQLSVEPDSDFYIWALYCLALVRRDLGFVEEACALLETVVTTETNMRGGDTLICSRYRSEWGHTLSMIPAERERGRAVLVSAVERLEALFGAKHFRTVDAVAKLAALNKR
jgi:tetratricopeptide (TPR) repeat protein